MIANNFQRWAFSFFCGVLLLSQTHCITGGAFSALPEGISSEEVEESGSSGSTGSQRLSTIITLLGNIDIPTVSGNISSPDFSLTEGSLASQTCHAYTLEGDDLGTFRSNTLGRFAITVTFNASLYQVGDTWEKNVILQCSNGLSLIRPVSLVIGTDDEYNIGTINSLTTFAVVEIIQKISGWTSWNQDFSSFEDDLDLSCYKETMQSLWEVSSIDNDGVQEDLSIFKETMDAYWAARSTNLYDYSKVEILMRNMIDGNLDDNDIWPELLEDVTSYNDEIDVDDFEDQYFDAYLAHETITEILSDLFEEDGLGNTINDISAAVSVASNSLCDLIKDDEISAEALVSPLLYEDNVTSLSSTYNNEEGSAILVGLLLQCNEDNSCEQLVEKPTALNTFLHSYDEDFDSIYTTSAGYTDYALPVILEFMNACEGETEDDLNACMQAMYATLEHGETGWGYFVDGSGNPLESRIRAWAGYWMSQINSGFNPLSVVLETRYENAVNELGASFTGAGADTIADCVEEVLEEDSYDTSACYPGLCQVYNLGCLKNEWDGTFTGGQALGAGCVGTPTSVTVSFSGANTITIGEDYNNDGTADVILTGTFSSTSNFNVTNGGGTTCAINTTLLQNGTLQEECVIGADLCLIEDYERQ